MLGDSLGGEGGRSDYSRPGGRARPSHGVQPGGRSQERHRGTTSSVRRLGPSGKDHFKRAEISQAGAFPARAVMPHASCAEGESPRRESAQTPAVAGRPPCGRDAGVAGSRDLPAPEAPDAPGRSGPDPRRSSSAEQKGARPGADDCGCDRTEGKGTERGVPGPGQNPSVLQSPGPGLQSDGRETPAQSRRTVSPPAPPRPARGGGLRWPAVAVSTTSLPGRSCHRVNAGVAVRVRLRRTPSGVDARREVRRS